jgi:hypothetical protein
MADNEIVAEGISRRCPGLKAGNGSVFHARRFQGWVGECPRCHVKHLFEAQRADERGIEGSSAELAMQCCVNDCGHVFTMILGDELSHPLSPEDKVKSDVAMVEAMKEMPASFEWDELGYVKMPVQEK